MNLTPDGDVPDCPNCGSSKTAKNLDAYGRREYVCLEDDYQFGDKKSQV